MSKKKVTFLHTRGRSEVQVIIGEKQVPSSMNPTVMETRPDYVMVKFDPLFETDDPVLIDALKKHPHYGKMFQSLEKKDEEFEIKALHQTDPRAKEYVETLDKARALGIKVDPEIPLSEIKAQIAAAEGSSSNGGQTGGEVIEVEAEVVESEPVRDASEVLDVFLKDKCKFNEGSLMPFRELYRAYKVWCSENGYKPLHHFGLAKLLKQVPVIRVEKQNKKSIVIGLELK